MNGTVTFEEFSRWLAGHDVDMNECVRMLFDIDSVRSHDGLVRMEVTEYETDGMGRRFMHAGTVAVRTRLVLLHRLPGTDPRPEEQEPR